MYAIDGDGIVINSAIGRRWPTNLLCDPPGVNLKSGKGIDSRRCCQAAVLSSIKSPATHDPTPMR